MTNPRRRLVGTVVSTKMTRTVVVRVDRTVRHPLYGKVVHRSEKFLAHDEQGCKNGDRVRIVESQPLSKRKRWVVEEVVTRGQFIEVPKDVAAGGES
jgi:small subunit ribosomal protein S17